MPRSFSVPAYSLHKPSGRAVVKIKGRSFYLGAYGSDESRINYARIIADILAGLAITPPAPSNQDNSTPVATITVGELVTRYKQHAGVCYGKGDSPMSEVASIHCALKYLLDA